MNAGAILIALLVMVIPGAGASLALHRPGEAGIPTRLATCFGLGYAAVALTAVVLEILHALVPASFVLLLAAVTVALWAAGLRRASLREHAAALREELQSEGLLAAAGLAAIVLFAAMRLRFSPLLNFSMFGPWRYWADGIEIADAGRVPHQTLQWGAAYTPTVSKVILNSYQAGMSYLIGSAPLPAMGALLWVASVGLACGLYALGRELGLRRTAALLPLLALVLVDNELHRDLDVYTAENTGRMAAVCALVLGVRALRRRQGWQEPVAAGVLFAVAAGSHGIPAFVLMLGLGCYAAALLVIERERRAIVLRGMAVVGVTVLVWGAALGLSGGDVGFQGAGGNDRYASFGASVDPTASLFTGKLVDRSGGDHWYIPPENLARGLVASATTRPAGDLALIGVPLLALAAALVLVMAARRAAAAGAVRGAAVGRAVRDRAVLLVPLPHLHPGHVRAAPGLRLRLPAAVAARCWAPSNRGWACSTRIRPALPSPALRRRGGGCRRWWWQWTAAPPATAGVRTASGRCR